LYLSVITGCTANKYIHVKDIDDEIDDEKLSYILNDLQQQDSNKNKWSPAVKSKPNTTGANRRTWLGGKYRSNQIIPGDSNEIYSDLDSTDDAGSAKYRAKPETADEV